MLDWTQSDDDAMPNCCVWFNDYDTLHKQIASVVRSFITDKVPTVLASEAEKVLSRYSRENTKKQITEYLSSVLDRRKHEMEELITRVNKNEE